MTSLYRRLFFWIFVVFFVLTAPVAILYSQGYRFDQYKRIFVHSGSITVKSTPSGVNIYLNGEIRPSGALDIINNSITVNGLRPGTYNLRVTADGYQDWEKNIEVHSGLSTEFWNVFLVPKNIAANEILSDGVERYFPSASGKYVAYSKKNGDQLEIWILDVKNNSSTRIFSQNGFEFASDQLKNIEWNENESSIIIPVEKDSQENFVVLDIQNAQEPTFLSQTVEVSGILNARWSPNNQNEIYFLAKASEGSSSNLYRLTLPEKKTELVLEGTRTFDISSSAIYFLRQNNIVYKSNLDGKNEEQIILKPLDFSQEGGNMRLIAYDDYRQAILSGNGELFVHNNGEINDSLKKIADGVTSMQFSNDGKKLLYWNNSEIDVLYLRKWDVQPRREENETQQIIRFSSPIKNVFWYRDYEHVLFSTQGAIKIVELDSRDHKELVDILKYNSENFLSSYDSGNGIYYYIDAINGTKKLFYFYMPEQTSFFGG